jgi:hypothetical protein
VYARNCIFKVTKIPDRFVTGQAKVLTTTHFLFCAVWTGTSSYTPRGLRRPQDFIQQPRNARIHNPIVDVEAIFLVQHHIGLAQEAQLLRDVGLGTPQHNLQMAHARRAAPQFIQDVQPRRVGQQLKNRCALSIFGSLFRHCSFYLLYALNCI